MLITQYILQKHFSIYNNSIRCKGRYIINNLPYIHLLPLDEHSKKLTKIAHYFNVHSYKNNSSIKP